MKIVVNLKKGYFFSIIALVLLLGAVGVGVAYNSGKSPSEFGHSAEEIEITLGDGSKTTLNNAVTNNIFGGSGITRPLAFDINGSYTWTVPAGITRIMVETWGAGGGGGCSSGPTGGMTSGGSGGGSGGYSRSILTVTPGQVYSIFVGTGGSTCGSTGTRESGRDGTFSSFTGNGFTVKAYPGKGGVSGYNGAYSSGQTDPIRDGSRVSGTGGLGAVVASSGEGDERLPGNNGQDSDGGCGDFGCGDAAKSANGGFAVRPVFASTYGVGGSGAAANTALAFGTSTVTYGEKGRNGAVVVYYNY